MLTVFDLDGFVDQLGDLTRAADPMDIVVEATALVADNQAQRFLMQHRAAAALDAHYLHGVALRRIAMAAGLTTQTVRNWITDHGPGHYLSIAREEPRPGEPWRFVLRLIAIDSDDTVMKRKLREARAAGRRIVPAMLNLVDPDSHLGYADRTRWPMEPAALWEQLGD
jgi:hypothetical protein